MDARIAKERTMQWIRANSGLEQDRDYLGMSQIGRCRHLLYQWLVNGKGEASDMAHLRCVSGYMYEKKILDILCGAGIVDDEHGGLCHAELVAPFDSRFRGHIDAVAADGSLVEIKTFRQDDFNRVTRANQIPTEYVWQIQAYMRYGNFNETLLVLVCRDPFLYWTMNVRRDDVVGQQLESKAKRILAAFDAGTSPACECGRCDR